MVTDEWVARLVTVLLREAPVPRFPKYGEPSPRVRTFETRLIALEKRLLKKFDDFVEVVVHVPQFKFRP